MFTLMPRRERSLRLNQKQKSHFTIIALVIGFMVAVQFQTTQHPKVRDTRDMWELRADLTKEQKTQADILREIRALDGQLENYRTNKALSKKEALNKTLMELKKEAGATPVTGVGLKLTISPLFGEEFLGKEIKDVSPQLLKHLVNDLNSYDADEIAIGDQRIVATTVIRDINGRTKVNNYWLGDAPFQVTVLTKDPEKMYNRLKASNIADEFAIEDLSLEISNPHRQLTVPAYDQEIPLKGLTVDEAE